MDEKNAERLAICKSNNSASCTLANNTVLTRYGTKYTTSKEILFGKRDEDGHLASENCISKGMHLMSFDEYIEFRENGLEKNFYWVEENKIAYDDNLFTPDSSYRGAYFLCVESD